MIVHCQLWEEQNKQQNNINGNRQNQKQQELLGILVIQILICLVSTNEQGEASALWLGVRAVVEKDIPLSSLFLEEA